MIKTNHLGPFLCLNRLPYYFAIRCLIHECGKFPEIKSLYLISSSARGDWVPGRSDVDLTLVIDSGLNAEKEFLFLVSFWKRYERLKKWFLMLDQPEIWDDKLIKIRTRFGIRGYESKYWKLLYGAETISNNYVTDQERLSAESFNHALRTYSNTFLKIFFSQRHVSLELQRAAHKILKYIDYGCDKNSGFWKGVDSCSKEGLLCRIIMEFERLVTLRYKGLVKSDNVSSDYPVSRNLMGQGRLAALNSYQGAIEGIAFVPKDPLKAVEKEKNYLIVLKDGLSASETKGCVDAILKVFNGHNNLFILSKSVFVYMFHVQDPFRCYGLIPGAQIVYGRDLNSEIQPIDEYFLLKSIIEQVMDIIVYSRRKRIISPSRGDSFKVTLRLTISAKLYLDKKDFVWGWDELLRKYEEFYPQYHERIVKNKENGPGLERFMLLKDLVNDISEQVSKINLDKKQTRPCLIFSH